MSRRVQLKLVGPPPRKRAPNAAPAAAGASTARGAGTQHIVDTVTTAIVERRLMPGTKLVEQQLADLFEVSRTIVRQALNQLSRDRLVTLEPARGAFVSQPSLEEARQVFEVRKMLEASMIRRLCASISSRQIVELRAHLKAELEAVQQTDVPGRTWLLSDFHLVLARMLGNDVLAELLADLLSRSALISLMYQSTHSAIESQQEHVAIVDALERRDVRAALRLTEVHLESVGRNLNQDQRSPDLASVLRPPPARD